MRQANEPSVEEILESIKKVIARDSRAAPAESPRHDPPVPHGDLAEDDDGRDDEVLDLTGMVEPAPLITENAVSSMRESLAALASVSGPGAAPQIVRSGETSLEGLVRELLRPMLAEWLDRNLPPLVERLVASEIARIVGKKG